MGLLLAKEEGKEKEKGKEEEEKGKKRFEVTRVLFVDIYTSPSSPLATPCGWRLTSKLCYAIYIVVAKPARK